MSNAPPLRLPGEHFVVALGFFALGAVALGLVGPELAEGKFTAPYVAAVVHLFTLGYICLSIFGSLYQFLPVAIGVPIRSQRLAHVTFALLLVGIPTFVTAVALTSPRWLPIGAGLVALGFSLFAGNFIATLARAKERSITWWALCGAALYLVVTLGFGFLLALNLATGVASTLRFELLLAHIHVAIIGWVLLVMVGVGHRLIPMFMLSHGATERPAQVAIALLTTGCALIALPLGMTVHAVGFLVVVAGVLAFIGQALAFYHHRKKGELDPGMRLAMLGLASIVAALLLAPWAWLRGWQNVRLLTTYVFLLIGGVSMFIAGHYFKIVPFIVWYHRFGAQVGKSKVPRVADLYSSRRASLTLVALGAGVGLVALGILLGQALVVRGGALALVLGIAVEAREMIRVVSVRTT